MNIPKLGEKQPILDTQGRHRGFKYWVICPVCHKGRWVREEGTKRPAYTGMCNRCHPKFIARQGETNPAWTGGIIKRGKYMGVKLFPDDFFYPMAGKEGYVLEHRLVMAKHLNRCLLPWEVVHHKNGLKVDNRLENLQLLRGQHSHISDSILKSSLRKLEKTIIKQQSIIDKLNTLLGERIDGHS